MKGPLDRTKVVLRHLPPSISQAILTDQIDPKFSGRYNWLSFFPGNSSQKRAQHSRAYINFNKPEDVIEFAEFFNGHVFVNEKGAQYKAIVEYAPSQHVPKQCPKKDGREGIIFRDPEYLEFLEFIGKPVEHLPSAEIQLERREAEQAAAGKEALIITPLMDFVRKKRAASVSRQRSLANGKSVRRTRRRSSESRGAITSKQSERKRVTSTMYVRRDTAKAASGQNGSADSLMSQREDQKCSEKVVLSGGLASDEAYVEETGIADSGKKEVLLLRGKKSDLSHFKLSSSGKLMPKQHKETSVRIIRNVVQPERIIKSSKTEKDGQPQSSNVRLLSKTRNGISDKKTSGNDVQVADKSDRRVRNKERPDRVVWTPLRRPDGLLASEESLPSASPSMQIPQPSSEGSPVYVGRRRLPQVVKDADGSVPDGKSARRGVSSSYNSQEKQVWVQKSSPSS